jgi:hypothetical protein
MGAHEQALGVMMAAEEKLRAILVQAAAAGDYDHLPQIAEWAKLLTKLLGGRTPAELAPEPLPAPLPEPPKEEQLVPSGNGVHQTVDTEPIAVQTRSPRKVKASRSKKPKRAKAAKGGYPHFVRDGESLVKIGWSKSEGRPYEHKAPHGVLRALVQALVRDGADGKRFTVEPLLPLTDAAGLDIPDYQAYLALAWLRSIGLVLQHGRQGYSLPENSNLERDSVRQWNALTTR